MRTLLLDVEAALEGGSEAVHGLPHVADPLATVKIARPRVPMPPDGADARPLPPPRAGWVGARRRPPRAWGWGFNSENETRMREKRSQGGDTTQRESGGIT
jgi:hypothetical protein